MGVSAKLTRILVRSACAPRNRNAFVYYEAMRNGVGLPDIPVVCAEHYGQCGEDLIVAALIEARAVADGVDTKQLRYLEIGGNHPFATSATFLLHTRLSMTGVIVEANSKLIADLKKGRPHDTIVHAAVTDSDAPTAKLWISPKSELSSLDQNFSIEWAGRGQAAPRKARLGEEVPAIRVNALIERYMAGASPCFVSIDIEGFDLRILKDFDFRRFRPWFIQVEPSDDYFPGNSGHIGQLMHSVGYRLVAKTDVNLIFGEVGSL
jgi:FkbM family methyltransferase